MLHFSQLVVLLLQCVSATDSHHDTPGDHIILDINAFTIASNIITLLTTMSTIYSIFRLTHNSRAHSHTQFIHHHSHIENTINGNKSRNSKHFKIFSFIGRTHTHFGCGSGYSINVHGYFPLLINIAGYQVWLACVTVTYTHFVSWAHHTLTHSHTFQVPTRSRDFIAFSTAMHIEWKLIKCPQCACCHRK